MSGWSTKPARTRHGSISRINIATNKVSYVAKLSFLSYLVSLATAGPYLWIAGASESGILRIDRTTLAVSTFSSTLIYPIDVLCADKSYLWAASDIGGPLGRGSREGLARHRHGDCCELSVLQ